jgi:hypothetical protein
LRLRRPYAFAGLVLLTLTLVPPVVALGANNSTCVTERSVAGSSVHIRVSQCGGTQPYTFNRVQVVFDGATLFDGIGCPLSVCIDQTFAESPGTYALMVRDTDNYDPATGTAPNWAESTWQIVVLGSATPEPMTPAPPTPVHVNTPAPPAKYPTPGPTATPVATGSDPPSESPSSGQTASALASPSESSSASPAATVSASTSGFPSPMPSGLPVALGPTTNSNSSIPVLPAILVLLVAVVSVATAMLMRWKFIAGRKPSRAGEPQAPTTLP